MLRNDGLYVSQAGDSYTYLRYYKDQTVIEVSSTGKPHQVAEWFDTGNRYVAKGRYYIEEHQIRFSTTTIREISEISGLIEEISSSITVDYSGVIHEKFLALHSYSHFNGNRDFREYHFVKVTF